MDLGPFSDDILRCCAQLAVASARHSIEAGALGGEPHLRLEIHDAPKKKVTTCKEFEKGTLVLLPETICFGILTDDDDAPRFPMKIFVGNKHSRTLACKPPAASSGVSALWFVSQTAETEAVNMVSTSLLVGVVRHAEWTCGPMPTFNRKATAADKAAAADVEVPPLINVADLPSGTELFANKFNGTTKKRPGPSTASAAKQPKAQGQ